MKPFANNSERIYDLLDRGMRGKSAGAKQKKKAKLRQRKRFRSQMKESLLKENF